jgi:hypothetical protein
MVTSEDKNKITRSKLTTPLTRLERNVTRVKDFIEAAPLVPTWGLHKYLPQVRNAGAEERGSHWRRY